MRLFVLVSLLYVLLVTAPLDAQTMNPAVFTNTVDLAWHGDDRAYTVYYIGPMSGHATVHKPRLILTGLTYGIYEFYICEDTTPRPLDGKPFNFKNELEATGCNLLESGTMFVEGESV